MEPLALEWPSDVLLNPTETVRLSDGVAEFPFFDVELEIAGAIVDGALPFRLVSEAWTAPYRLLLSGEGMAIEADADELTVLTPRTTRPLSEYLSRVGLIVLLSGDALLSPPGVLYRPNRTIPAYSRDDLIPLDWSGIPTNRESRGRERDPATVQGLMLELLLLEDWDIVIDDDGSGEVADLVALRHREGELEIRLVHCKFAPGRLVRVQVEDLFQLCGQAEKSVVFRREPDIMIRKLLQRERTRLKNGRPTGFERGSAEDLARLQNQLDLVTVSLNMSLVQPSLSRSRASAQQLELLGAVQTYLYETSWVAMEVICSE